MKKITVLFLFLVSLLTVDAAVAYTAQDSLIYEKYIAQNKEDVNLPINKLIVRTALFFKDTPYVASTLDNNNSEQLVINLREFDCTTFVETCIALSRTLKTGDYSFANFCNQLKEIRYRKGEINDYSSRLHYVTDWIYNNSQKGILTDQTPSLGGEKVSKPINFMSTHPQSYKPLANSPQLQQKIANIEQQINQRDRYYVLYKNAINKADKKIDDGDVVVFATSIEGIDYSHIGIAYRHQGKLSFIHASSKYKKVTVEPQSLSSYCLKSSKCTGISVVRIGDITRTNVGH